MECCRLFPARGSKESVFSFQAHRAPRLYPPSTHARVTTWPGEPFFRERTTQYQECQDTQLEKIEASEESLQRKLWGSRSSTPHAKAGSRFIHPPTAQDHWLRSSTRREVDKSSPSLPPCSSKLALFSSFGGRLPAALHLFGQVVTLWISSTALVYFRFHAATKVDCG